MAEIVLHLGLHKTATGTLQRQFFPVCPDCRLLTTTSSGVRKFVHLVTRKDPLFFEPSTALELLQGVLDAKLPNLLSNESMSGPPYAGVIESDLDHRTAVLTNLQACFPDARAILVLRRQDNLARSFYRQYLKSGGTRGVRRFFGLWANSRGAMMTLDRFRFGPYVRAVTDAFPAGVLVLLFEELVEDQTAFLDKLTRFIGISNPGIGLRSENATRLGPVGMEVTRILNFLFRSHLNHGGLLQSPLYRNTVGGRRRLRPVALLHDRWPWGKPAIARGSLFETGQEILEMVKADNAWLDETFGLSLKRYGYY